MDLEEKKVARLKLLHKVYEITDGNLLHGVSLIELGKEFGINKEDTLREGQYMIEEGLLKYGARGPQWEVRITHLGVKEVEEALSHPNNSTTYFPAFNVIQVDQIDQSTNIYGNVDRSNISTHSSDVAQRAGQQAEISRLLEEIIKTVQGDGSLEAARRTELVDDAVLLKRELGKKEPRRGMVSAILGTLGDVSSVSSLAFQLGGLLG